MQVIKTKGTNTIFKAEGCYDLPVCRYEAEGGVSNESVFELDDADIARIVKTRRIYLNVYGSGHPPISVSLESYCGQDKQDSEEGSEKHE
jgi:hypothetical protein